MAQRLPVLGSILLLAACGSQATGAVHSESPSAGEVAGDPGDRMWDHFREASDARQAVIAGDLPGVRPHLEKLIALEYGEGLPADWMPWVEDMRTAARDGLAARTLDDAAVAIAALGGSCAECHRATAGGPDFEGDQLGYRDLGRKGMQERMARHMWSAEELWLGLIGPKHPAWSRGAAALMNISIPKLVTHRGTPATDDRRPAGDGTLQGSADTEPAAEPDAPMLTREGADLDVALEELRALGARADQAAIPREQMAVYAEIISRCGSCHRHLGIRVDGNAGTAVAP